MVYSFEFQIGKIDCGAIWFQVGCTNCFFIPITDSLLLQAKLLVLSRAMVCPSLFGIGILYYFDQVFMSCVTSPYELNTWAFVTGHNWL